MRKFAQVSPRFWTGKTGREIRKCGPQPVVLALYLMTAPGSHMSGLYYLPLVTVAHETGIPEGDVGLVVECLEKVGFCEYNDATEHVWVCEMARWQVGETLKERDNRRKTLTEWVANCADSRLAAQWLRRYSEGYRLSPAPPFVAPSEG